MHIIRHFVRFRCASHLSLANNLPTGPEVNASLNSISSTTIQFLRHFVTFQGHLLFQILMETAQKKENDNKKTKNVGFLVNFCSCALSYKPRVKFIVPYVFLQEKYFDNPYPTLTINNNKKKLRENK